MELTTQFAAIDSNEAIAFLFAQATRRLSAAWEAIGS
jgi:hypothetical protein